MHRPFRSELFADSGFLAVIVVLSLAPYVGKLGFYSDDWAYLGSLHSFGNFSNAGRSAEYDFGAYIHQRPTQAAYSWALFRLFGLHPLGYHLVNAAVLVAMTLLLYVVLRQLDVPRSVALATRRSERTSPQIALRSVGAACRP